LNVAGRVNILWCSGRGVSSRTARREVGQASTDGKDYKSSSTRGLHCDVAKGLSSWKRNFSRKKTETRTWVEDGKSYPLRRGGRSENYWLKKRSIKISGGGTSIGSRGGRRGDPIKRRESRNLRLRLEGRRSRISERRRGGMCWGELTRRESTPYNLLREEQKVLGGGRGKTRTKGQTMQNKEEREPYFPPSGGKGPNGGKIQNSKQKRKTRGAEYFLRADRNSTAGGIPTASDKPHM